VGAPFCVLPGRGIRLRNLKILKPWRCQVVAYDFGIKHNILRRLASFNCRITVVPADYPAEGVLALNPDGIFLSNGPVWGLGFRV
jgi:carbamoylphosphate synthase small subunit